eukprot:TRINITY_DN52715_c0_g1_i1.p1 TRINITY_DN52715_c0_g1~~TRINITY_DN52715_c0_g1_i1.p1  ORF type:complete len:232 (+),score=104.66 TRINITY_DN52715_c0_g1_i1:48-743(+)
MALVEGEKKVEKEKCIPKDGQVMISILKDMGINDFEPRVVNQMLEFSYRYVTNILEEAKVFSQHAGKKQVDLDDVKLSVTMQAEQSFTAPPPRESLLELARVKNATQLPIPQNKLGLRLPPDRHCLTNTNYKLKGKNKPAGFDYGTPKPNYRGKKGQTNSNKNPSNFSVVGSKVVNNTGNQIPLMADDSMGNNGGVVPGQPVFKIQVAPQTMGGQMGQVQIKRKREDDDYD